MKSSIHVIVAAAAAGILGATIVACSSNKTSTNAGAMEKHACKGMNSCSGKGGCKTAKNECAGKNGCKGQGGCATVEKHDCATKNACSGQGGCKSASHECAGKNTCKSQGGCAVPVGKK